MRAHKPPYRLGDGVTIAVGSPYGTELGDRVAPGARRTPVGTPFTDARNPALLQGVRGLAIEGIAFHKNFVALSYRGDGLPRLAITTKGQAARDFLAGRPWSFTELHAAGRPARNRPGHGRGHAAQGGHRARRV